MDESLPHKTRGWWNRVSQGDPSRSPALGWRLRFAESVSNIPESPALKESQEQDIAVSGLELVDRRIRIVFRCHFLDSSPKFLTFERFDDFYLLVNGLLNLVPQFFETFQSLLCKLIEWINTTRPWSFPFFLAGSCCGGVAHCRSRNF